MAMLHLVPVVERPTSFGATTGNIQVTLQDGDRTVVLPVPMYHYGATGVVAFPHATLTGSVISLNLGNWVVYDLDTNRPTSLTFCATDPGATNLVRVVESYVRDARHLSTDDLHAWVASLINAAGGESR
jgi:hypothetical protein